MPLIHKPRSQKQKHPVWGVFYFWWEWLDCNSHIRCRSMGPFRLRLEPGGSHLTTHSQKQKPTIRSVCVFGGSGWIRTSSGLSQQIYSLPRLSNSGARPNFTTTSWVACHTKPWRSVVRAAGIEPAFQAWKACILAFVLCPQQIQSHVIIY